MKRQEYAAIFEGYNQNHILLMDIINLETGLLFREHCWVAWQDCFKQIPTKSTITFKARERFYRKRIPVKEGIIKIITQKELVKINSVKVMNRG